MPYTRQFCYITCVNILLSAWTLVEGLRIDRLLNQPYQLIKPVNESTYFPPILFTFMANIKAF